ncbi:hypothetical protein V5799_005348 [Amblyomma americanum]|uniref:THAP-type domain-containing protein n=1 Tax=Amblyomma americanum TaxID=6943 RepID=A0AAQ4DZI1_AMBAM
MSRCVARSEPEDFNFTPKRSVYVEKLRLSEGVASFDVGLAAHLRWASLTCLASSLCRFSKFVPTTGHRVCSAHFEGGKKTYMVRVPSIFPLRQQKVEKRRLLTRTEPEVSSTSTVCTEQRGQEVSAFASSLK